MEARFEDQADTYYETPEVTHILTETTEEEEPRGPRLVINSTPTSTEFEEPPANDPGLSSYGPANYFVGEPEEEPEPDTEDTLHYFVTEHP